MCKACEKTPPISVKSPVENGSYLSMSGLGTSLATDTKLQIVGHPEGLQKPTDPPYVALKLLGTIEGLVPFGTVLCMTPEDARKVVKELNTAISASYLCSSVN